MFPEYLNALCLLHAQLWSALACRSGSTLPSLTTGAHLPDTLRNGRTTGIKSQTFPVDYSEAGSSFEVLGLEHHFQKASSDVLGQLEPPFALRFPSMGHMSPCNTHNTFSHFYKVALPSQLHPWILTWGLAHSRCPANLGCIKIGLVPLWKSCQASWWSVDRKKVVGTYCSPAESGIKVFF